MNQPLISIIVPIYNVEKYLDKCVTSLVSQTYQNIEILLVDDGSPDNSPALCDQWAARDPRITVIHKKNGGLSDARNAGLDQASGEYITFVDSDDYVHDTYVEVLYRTLVENDADVSACNFRMVNEQGAFLPENAVNKLRDDVCSGEDVLNRYFAFNGTGNTLVVAWGKLYKGTLFSNLRFPLGKIHEDEFLFFPIYMNVKTAAFTEASLYFYLQRQGSILHSSVSEKRVMDLCDCCEMRLALFSRESDLYKKISVNYALQIFAILDRIKDHQLSSKMASVYRRHIVNIHYKCVDFPLFHKIAYLLVAITPKTFATLIHLRWKYN